MSFDSGHWYLPDGSPFYTVLSKDGTERGVTLRDARKKLAVPSVTTVLQVLAKPQLERWKVKQGILAALTLPKVEGEDEDTYLHRIDVDASAQAKAAAEEGTRIHDAIEASFKGKWFPSKYQPHVSAARAWVADEFPHVTDWVAEKSFAHEDGFGGKVDLHSPSTGIVIDYKGKDGDFTDGKRLAYDQHYQLAAYQHGLNIRPNICANLFVSRTHPGCVSGHVWREDEIDYGKQVFLDALRLWKTLKKYDPSETRMAA